MASPTCARCGTSLKTAALGALCPACVRVEHDGIGTVRAPAPPAAPAPAAEAPAPPAPAGPPRDAPPPGALFVTLPAAGASPQPVPSTLPSPAAAAALSLTQVSPGAEVALPSAAAPALSAAASSAGSQVGQEWIPPATGLPSTAPSPAPLPAPPARRGTVPMSASPVVVLAPPPAPMQVGAPQAAPMQAPYGYALRRTGPSATATIVATLAVIAAIASAAWTLRKDNQALAEKPTTTAPTALPAPPKGPAVTVHALAFEESGAVLAAIDGDFVRLDGESLARTWKAPLPPGTAPVLLARDRGAWILARGGLVERVELATGAVLEKAERAGTATAICEVPSGLLVAFGGDVFRFEKGALTAAPKATCEPADSRCDVGVDCMRPPKGLVDGRACTASLEAAGGKGRYLFCPLEKGGLVAALDEAGTVTWKTTIPFANSPELHAFSLRGDAIHVAVGEVFATLGTDGMLTWTGKGEFHPAWRRMGRLFAVKEGALTAFDARTGEALATYAP